MYLLILSLCAILAVFYLFLLLFLKCKMPFWSKQPVFHWYNLMYWLGGPPGLIDPSLPLINKYVDLFNIKTFSLADYEPDTKQTNKNDINKTICEFIKANYIYASERDKTQVDYSPSQENLLAYLLNSNHPSYFTVYQEPNLLFTEKEDLSSTDIIAVIAARPLYVRLNKKGFFGAKKTMFTTYYVDNLCVQPAYRKKGIAATMIQTHYYNLRQQNKQINTCLFKREGELNAIVPLVAFKTYCLSIANILHNNNNNNDNDKHIATAQYSLIESGANQLHLFIDFIKSQMSQFNCVILPDVTNLAHLIKTNNLRIYCLVSKASISKANVDISKANNNIIAVYIFRLLELTYDTKKTCECIATINATTMDLFQYGFRQACTTLQEKNEIALLLVEETAHTKKLLTPQIKAQAQFTSPTAFFFYNYACHSLKAQECLIVY